MASTSSQPALSVVIAAVDGRASIVDVVQAVRVRRPGPDTEVLVVANANHPGLFAVREGGLAQVIESDRRRLIPELWGLGVAASSGRVVAITMAGCLPGPGWGDEILRAHEASTAAAIGGAIEQAEPAGAADWALYFARYASYAGPFAAKDVTDVPGDNGTYKRAAIEQDLAYIREQGFWETEINARLRTRGERLTMVPGMPVWHTYSYGASAFARQRREHGRLHGATRARGMSTPTRLVRACAAPLAWATMMLRVTRHVRARRRFVRPFIVALPLVAWFYGSWIAGEVEGLLRGPR